MAAASMMMKGIWARKIVPIEMCGSTPLTTNSVRPKGGDSLPMTMLMRKRM